MDLRSIHTCIAEPPNMIDFIRFASFVSQPNAFEMPLIDLREFFSRCCLVVQVHPIYSAYFTSFSILFV